jgi:four helix bundle protein
LEKTRDLEERLVAFSVKVLNLAERLPDSRAGKYFHDQLVRSGISPALNYGEPKSAESPGDFIHKMKICLKELRETFIALKIIQAKPLLKDETMIGDVFTECNELISIFVKSIQTAEKNRKKSS